jgi:hypothetical protein
MPEASKKHDDKHAQKDGQRALGLHAVVKMAVVEEKARWVTRDS